MSMVVGASLAVKSTTRHTRHMWITTEMRGLGISRVDTANNSRARSYRCKGVLEDGGRMKKGETGTRNKDLITAIT
jgi:hypothetical protein